MKTYQDVAEGMKAGMRRLAKGVTVITLRDLAGQRYAMTASAVTSLSDSPASLLICANKTSSLAPHFVKATPFCVNVLSHNMELLSNRCAGKEKGEARFDVGDWVDHESTQLPFINNAEAVFFCVSDDVKKYGTHLIVIGKIVEVKVATTEVNPLIYVDGGYRQLKM